jgi:glutaconate CoA-transferase subunit B
MTYSYTPFSYTVINLARLVRANEVTFSGVNSTLPMLACLLAKKAYSFDFTWLNVAGGVDAELTSPVPLSSGDAALVEGSAAIFGNDDFYDLCTRGGMDLCFLGCSQIDGSGATNNSVIGDWHSPKVRLPGGGGSAVMMPTLKRAATWRTEHSKRTLVDKLFFQTAKGNLQNLVTPIAVFNKFNGRLALESHHPDVTPVQVQSVTEFMTDMSNAKPTPPPTDAEVSALASLDPDGVFERDAAIKMPSFC